MPSLNELRKRRDLLLDNNKVLTQKSQLKSEIFQLKHGGKIRVLKNIGGGIATAGKIGGKGIMKYAEYYDKNSRSTKSRKTKGKRNAVGYNPGSLF